ncbi:hypothetical protein [Lewinella sp. W8]|uniref:hypothetical protein n=1 Tax=Lewinella sp. W8 TaxID=2528208 RepID=UPI0010675345|nr:hypothetical protein [Lewinella sp. W8]MTB49803.1 hypothetical protein [Lewinella sp. W8]
MENLSTLPPRILPRAVLEFQGLTSAHGLDRIPTFLSHCHLIPGDLTYVATGDGEYTIYRITSGKCVAITPRNMGNGKLARFKVLAVEDKITAGHSEYDSLVAAIEALPAEQKDYATT